MFRKIALAATVLAATLNVNTAKAADIVVTKASNTTTVVSVIGEIKLNDGLKFKRKTAKLKGHVVVGLSSPGGSVVAGLTIGYITRANGWDTFAGPDMVCASACADIWLAGKTRFLKSTSKIGMHSEGMKLAYRGKAESIRGDNLERIQYFALLGLGRDAIVAMLTPDPTDMMWLTTTKAEKLGIEYKMLD